MIEVEILDSSTASLDGVTVTGPLHLFGDELTVGSSAYVDGYFLVSGGAATQTLPHTALQMELLPLFVCVLFFLGLKYGHSLARAIFA
jgi:hypothetical protein